MRVPQFLRRSKPAPRSKPLGPPAGDAGLQAFASETAAPDEAPSARSVSGFGSGSRFVPGVLATLVILQAGPSILWLQDRVAAWTTTMAAPDAAPPDSTPAPAPACEPAEPSPTATTGPVPAAPPRAPRTVAAAPAGVIAGLVSVTAPVPMHVYVRGRLVGTTEAETIMLPVGTHELDFVNEAVGYRVRRTVAVQASRTSQVRLETPSGTLSVNAQPWAEVWVDKQRVGETPLGNVRAPIGQREVIFRHPELGERRTTVLVTVEGTARVSMDLRGR